MFRDVYHKANDDIPVNKDLLNAILSEKPKKHKYLYPRFTVAAGILLISAAVLAYPKMTNKTTDNIAPQVTLAPIETAVPYPEVPNQSTAPVIENNFENNSCSEKDVPAVSKAENTKAPSKNADAPATRTAAPQPTHTQQPTHTPQANNYDKPEQIDAAKAEPDNSSAQNTQTAEPAPTEHIADTQVSLPEVKGVNSDPINRDSLTTECWSEERYFEYLGRSVTPSVPADMTKISDAEKNMTLYAETGAPCYDMWALKYSSEDGARKITVKISKTALQCAASSKSEQHREMTSSDIFFKIDADGLSQEEFDTLCNSLL